LGSFFENCGNIPLFGRLFSSLKTTYILMSTIMACATFWATLPQTHPVTLLASAVSTRLRSSAHPN
jgi:hypothetical protein